MMRCIGTKPIFPIAVAIILGNVAVVGAGRTVPDLLSLGDNALTAEDPLKALNLYNEALQQERSPRIYWRVAEVSYVLRNAPVAREALEAMRQLSPAVVSQPAWRELKQKVDALAAMTVSGNVSAVSVSPESAGAISRIRRLQQQGAAGRRGMSIDVSSLSRDVFDR